jgi:HPt (histidine-containing phosphotransfer) domain-containing protein
MNADGIRPLPGPDESPLIDEPGLAELEAFGPEFLAELTTAFDEETTRMLAALDDGLRAADPESVRRAAHTMKGAAATIGLTRAAAWAAALEQAARTGALDDAGPILPGLRRAIDDGLVAIRARAGEISP